jgi:hypothetical protein
MTTEIGTIETVRTIGRASVEAQELFKFLQATTVGQLITYTELDEAAKTSVQAHPNILQTARRMMEREHRATFGTVRGIGIKRLGDEEIPDEASASIKRARNIARKGRRVLACANYEKLSAEARVRHTVTGTILGFMEQAGKRKTLNLAEQSARVSNGDMKIGAIENLFKPAAKG